MIRNFLRNFMIGRYGPDQLGVATIILSLILSVVSSVTGLAPVMYASYAFLILELWRMLSKNITRRRAENDRYLRFWWPIRTKIKAFFCNIKARKTHLFIKCPSCHNMLRLPRGKGKLQVTCPKCGERFFKKT